MIRDLIIPWKRQILYWILAFGITSLFLWMDTGITP